VVDLAVGIVIGAAFGAVITALIADLITPIIGLFGGFSFPDLQVTVHRSVFRIGDFINVVLSFLLIALVVFFLVVRPVNALNRRVRQGEEVDDPSMRLCPYCCNRISAQAVRCGFCTSTVSATDGATQAQ
jgi:large conductance mechanosensitive channel